MSRKKSIDETDILILNHLQRDGSLTNVKLSELIGLTPNPTLNRVNTLRATHAIEHIVAKINYGYFGYNYRAMITSQVSLTNLDAFLVLLRSLEFVLTAHRLRGASPHSTLVTIMYEVVGKSEESLAHALAYRTAMLPFEVSYEVFPVTQVIKDVSYIELTNDDVQR